MTARVRVVKVGGSLLGWSSLPAALTKWLARQSPAVNVLLAGGGEFADVVRRADAVYGLGEEAAHWLCVDALAVTARLLGALLKEEVITRAHELPSLSPAVRIFDPGPFLRSTESHLPSQPLPHTWSVTGDSIAARIAQHLAANELVLLKSCLPAHSTPGYVDDYFSTVAAALPHIRCVNLRSRDFAEITWDCRR